MNLKDLVSKVSTETSVPAAQVRKVANALLEALRVNVQSGENFTSPRLNIRAVTTKATVKVDKSGNKINVPEMKIGRMVPKEPKPKS